MGGAIFKIPTAPFNNANANPFGSQYANNYGFQTNGLLRQEVAKMIYDATPLAYYDMKILMAKEPEMVGSDEFNYFENQIVRQSLQTDILTTTIPAGTVQTIPVLDATAVPINAILTVPSTNNGAAVIAIDPDANTVTIRAAANTTLPALTAGSSYSFPQNSVADADGTSSIASMARLNNLIERYNYVQMFARSTMWGRMEKYKYEKTGQTDYIIANRNSMINQYMIGKSNAYWNGRKGSITLADGSTAKLMGGIYPTMLEAGSFQINTTPGNIYNALLEAANQSTYGLGNYPRFLYAHQKWIQNLYSQLKTNFIRYTAADDRIANLELDVITIGTGKIVLVPMQSFESKSNSFPAFFENTMFLLDQNSITPVMTWADKLGVLLGRDQNANNLNNYDLEYIEGTLSQKFENPLGSAIINIQV